LFLFQRPIDTVGGPDAKKARWSPNSFSAPTANGLVTPTSRDAFANYGYGSQAGIPQGFSNSSPPSAFAGALYSTSINTPTATMSGQISPSSANAFAQQQHQAQQQQQQQQQQQAQHQQQQQQQQQQQLNGNAGYGFGGYSMLGMGLPSVGMLGGFPYGAQVASFGGVCSYCSSGIVINSRQ
jgi:hypothetical protein